MSRIKGTLNGLAETYLSQFGYIASEEIQLRRRTMGTVSDKKQTEILIIFLL